MKRVVTAVGLLYLLTAFYMFWWCNELIKKVEKIEYAVEEVNKNIKVIEYESVSRNRFDTFDITEPTIDTDEQIAEEIIFGDIELLAQLIEAEAGNQDFSGKRLVADVVLNRVDAGWADGTISGVIFEDNQFSCIKDGGFDNAGWYISDESFNAAYMEYFGERLDSRILYFTAGRYNPYCVPMYKHGAHYFGY